VQKLGARARAVEQRGEEHDLALVRVEVVEHDPGDLAAEHRYQTGKGEAVEEAAAADDRRAGGVLAQRGLEPAAVVGLQRADRRRDRSHGGGG
jgi:hypothetical protein